MTFIEVCMLVVAIAAVAMAVAVVLAIRRLAPLAREAEGLSRDGRKLIQRLNAVTDDLEIAIHDARTVTGRVSNATELLDFVPQVSRLGSIASALGAGFRALSRVRADAKARSNTAANASPPATTPTPASGDSHE